MTRPVRHQDVKVIDAVIAYVRQCQAGMLGLSATPLEVSPGGRPQVGNSQAEYVAQFELCGRRTFVGKDLDVFRAFYAKLRSLDAVEAERIARTELGMTFGEFESHCAAIECSAKFAKVLKAHQMFRRWMQEEVEHICTSRNRGESNGRSVLSAVDVEEIRKLLRQNASGSQVAKLYGVSDRAIRMIKSGERWAEVNA